MVTIVSAKRTLLYFSFLSLGAISSGCNGRIYGVMGDVESSSVNCSQYPDLPQIIPMMDRLNDLFWQGTQTLDLAELQRIEAEIVVLAPQVQQGLDPKFTDPNFPTTYSWILNDRNLPAKAEFKVIGASIIGHEIPVDTLEIKQQAGYHILSFHHDASVLEVCAMSKSYQALVEVSANGVPLFYYRLMM